MPNLAEQAFTLLRRLEQRQEGRFVGSRYHVARDKALRRWYRRWVREQATQEGASDD